MIHRTYPKQGSLQLKLIEARSEFWVSELIFRAWLWTVTKRKISHRWRAWSFFNRIAPTDHVIGSWLIQETSCKSLSRRVRCWDVLKPGCSWLWLRIRFSCKRKFANCFSIKSSPNLKCVWIVLWWIYAQELTPCHCIGVGAECVGQIEPGDDWIDKQRYNAAYAPTAA